MLFRLYYGLLPDERTIAALSMLACYCYVYDWVNTHTNDTLESHEEELMTSSSFYVDPKKKYDASNTLPEGLNYCCWWLVDFQVSCSFIGLLFPAVDFYS